jgi:hypothetical protein
MKMNFLVAIVLLLGTAAANAQSGPQEMDLTGARPNAGGEPEEVSLRLGLLDIAEINDREQVFTADIPKRKWPTSPRERRPVFPHVLLS